MSADLAHYATKEFTRFPGGTTTADEAAIYDLAARGIVEIELRDGRSPAGSYKVPYWRLAPVS